MQQVVHLRSELGLLTRLAVLALENNELESPPKELLRRGTSVVLEYLRQIHQVRGGLGF